MGTFGVRVKCARKGVLHWCRSVRHGLLRGTFHAGTPRADVAAQIRSVRLHGGALSRQERDPSRSLCSCRVRAICSSCEVALLLIVFGVRVLLPLLVLVLLALVFAEQEL